MDRSELYRLMSWLSPAYPVGAFSYSHGLEWLVETGAVTDSASLQRWLADILLLGAAAMTRFSSRMPMELRFTAI